MTNAIPLGGARALDTFRVLADRMPVLIAFVNRDLRYEFVNQTYHEWFGWRLEDMVGREVRELLGEAAFARLEPLFQRVLAGEEVRYEMNVPLAGGSRVLQGIYLPYRDPDGEVTGFVALVEDESEREKTQEELRRSRELLAQAQRLGRLGSWEIELDTEGEFASASVIWSDETFRIFGLEGERHVTAAQYFGLVPAEEQPRLTAALGATVREGVPFDLVHRIVRPDGVERTLHCRGELRRLPGGSRVQVVGSVQDITEQRRTELALRESESRLKLAQGAAGIAIWEWNLAGDTARFTPEYYALYGMRPGEEFRNSAEWRALLHPEDRERVRRELDVALAGGKSYDTEFRVIWPDGSVHWLAGRGQVIRDATGRATGMIGVNFDVTTRREAEEQLRQSAKMEAIGRVAGGLAHDFNNQLHALLGFVDFLERDPSLSDTGRGDAAEIRRTAERMASMTQQLMAFSRRQVVEPVPLDLDAAVAEHLPMLQRLLGASIEIATDFSGDPLPVRMDRAQLLQVLMNLAINARDAMAEGGHLEFRTRLRVEDEPLPTTRFRPGVAAGRYAELRVLDEGEGIADEHLAQVFEPFFTTKAVGKGTGLGLATVHSIVTQHGGAVWAERRAERGAMFVVLLPVTAPAPALSEPEAPARPSAEDAPCNLVVVDDQEAVRQIIARTLLAEGFTVREAATAQEALAIIEEDADAVHAVVTDVVMPVMGGVRLAEALQARWPGMPVVLLTGYQEEDGITERAVARRWRVLQKPVSARVLAGAVRDAVAASGR